MNKPYTLPSRKLKMREANISASSSQPRIFRRHQPGVQFAAKFDSSVLKRWVVSQVFRLSWVILQVIQELLFIRIDYILPAFPTDHEGPRRTGSNFPAVLSVGLYSLTECVWRHFRWIAFAEKVWREAVPLNPIRYRIF